MNEWEWQLLEDKTPVGQFTVGNAKVKAGDRVRLRPRQGGDVLDIALQGQTAVIESIEQDYEGKIHVCVVLDDDPGRDMGLLRQPGHRFFFGAEEIEPIPSNDEHSTATGPKARILVAGIGNIFLGDDAFGVEVVKRLLASDVPAGVKVVDFGIRGFDLVYALQDGYETTILVDAFPHGQKPGTVSLVEPDLEALAQDDQAVIDTHGMHPINVLRMARTMDVRFKKIFLVGCEPATLGGEEGIMGLSEPVEAAVEEGTRLVRSLLEKILEKE